jgi:hypothetical protein
MDLSIMDGSVYIIPVKLPVSHVMAFPSCLHVFCYCICRRSFWYWLDEKRTNEDGQPLITQEMENQLEGKLSREQFLLLITKEKLEVFCQYYVANSERLQRAVDDEDTMTSEGLRRQVSNPPAMLSSR